MNMLISLMKAAFPGSFDPPTLGHINIIQRSAAIFEEITVIIAVNPQKEYFFSVEERFGLIAELIKPWKNVKAALCKGLIVDFLKKNRIPLLIRGIREGDFHYEYELSMMNKTLMPEIETVFLPADPKYAFIRSGAIKEIASLGGYFSAMVSPAVERAIKERIQKDPE